VAMTMNVEKVVHIRTKGRDKNLLPSLT